MMTTRNYGGGGRRWHRSSAWARACAALVLAGGWLQGMRVEAADWPEWSHRAGVPVAAPGMVRVALAPEVLDRGRRELEDLRLVDPAGREVPFILRRPGAVARERMESRRFRPSVQDGGVVLDIEADGPGPVSGIELSSPAPEFNTSADVEGGPSKTSLRPLVRGVPLYRVAGASQVRIELPAGPWRHLRVTVPGTVRGPVPFSGAAILGVEDPGPVESIPVTLKERVEGAGESRLVLDLGAAHLTVSRLRVETPETLFHRPWDVLARAMMDAEGEVRERLVASGAVVRAPATGEAGAIGNLLLPVEARIDSREVTLRLANGDSPPLEVASVTAWRRPVWLEFDARAAGEHRLLVGHRLVRGPEYDVGSLSGALQGRAMNEVAHGPLEANPGHVAPEALARWVPRGAAIDVRGWSHRRPVGISATGVQELELDASALAVAKDDQSDVRLISATNQIPYVIERIGAPRNIRIDGVSDPDPKRPRWSRWRLTLPEAGLPVIRLWAKTDAALFDRVVRLMEVGMDAQGRHVERTLGTASWRRSPATPHARLVLRVDGRPAGRDLWLEMDHGDNAPIPFGDFSADLPRVRVLFKALKGEGVDLVYGKADAAPPRYDLGMVADELISAGRLPAIPGNAVMVPGIGRPAESLGLMGTVLFWGVLAAVVGGLLVLIARFLPPAQG